MDGPPAPGRRWPRGGPRASGAPPPAPAARPTAEGAHPGGGGGVGMEPSPSGPTGDSQQKKGNRIRLKSHPLAGSWLYSQKMATAIYWAETGNNPDALSQWLSSVTLLFLCILFSSQWCSSPLRARGTEEKSRRLAEGDCSLTAPPFRRLRCPAMPRAPDTHLPDLTHQKMAVAIFWERHLI